MKHFKVLMPLFMLVVAALACSLPLETPPTVPTETPAPPTAEVLVTEGSTDLPTEPPFICAPDMVAAISFSVEFCYPGTVVTGFVESMIPEKEPDPDMAPWDYNPDMIEIALQQYPVINAYHQPVIHIYPVADYIALEPDIQTTLDSLQVLLAGKDPSPESIPFLPRFNAAQMMQGQVRYLDFRNGSGVRFLTQYGQAFMPINNVSAFYAFTGLTDDGQYFITASLPISHPDFTADNMTDPPEGWDAFLDNYETYMDEMETFLEGENLDAFTPNLALLDEMMASFLIPPTAIP